MALTSRVVGRVGGLCCRHTPASTGVLSKPPRQQALCTAGRGGAGGVADAANSSTVSPSEEHATTHFGFAAVPFEAKQGMVNDVFHRVADSYDLMNDVMSAGVHRAWKDMFVSAAGPLLSRDHSTRLLDVAGGTGDIAFRLADAMLRSPVTPPVSPEIVVADINPDMLRVGQDRASQRAAAPSSSPASAVPTFSWVEADAQALPLEDNTFDLYTIAFGIRNVPDVNAALCEAFRVLKPGGRFMCLEFSHVTVPGVRELYDTYSMHVIPEMGQVIAKDREAYQYLVESIRQFPTQDEFQAMIDAAGFAHTSNQNFTFGVVAMHSGFKPL